MLCTLPLKLLQLGCCILLRLDSVKEGVEIRPGGMDRDLMDRAEGTRSGKSTSDRPARSWRCRVAENGLRHWFRPGGDGDTWPGSRWGQLADARGPLRGLKGLETTDDGKLASTVGDSWQSPDVVHL